MSESKKKESKKDIRERSIEQSMEVRPSEDRPQTFSNPLPAAPEPMAHFMSPDGIPEVPEVDEDESGAENESEEESKDEDEKKPARKSRAKKSSDSPKYERGERGSGWDTDNEPV